MQCASCGLPVEAGWKLCPECGTSMPRVCINPACGQPVQPGWKLCPECGTRLTGSEMLVATSPSRSGPTARPVGDQPPAPAAPGMSGLHPARGLAATAPAQAAVSVKDSAITGGVSVSVSGGGVSPALPTQPGRSSIPTDPWTAGAKAPPPGAGGTQAGEVNVQDSVVTGGIHHTIYQTFVYGGQKYTLKPFPQGRSPFPVFRAQHEGGRTLVAKGLGDFPRAHELTQDLQRLHLTRFPSGIAPFKDCEVIQHETYLLREYCPGKSLAEVVNERGPLDGVSVVRILRGVTRLLMLVQSPHGGLSPANIFADGENQIRLADWGMEQVKDRIAAYDERFRQPIEEFRLSNSYICRTGEVLPPVERDGYSLAVVACTLMGVRVEDHHPAPAEMAHLPEVRARCQALPGLAPLIENALQRKLRSAFQFHNALGDIISAAQRPR